MHLNNDLHHHGGGATDVDLDLYADELLADDLVVEELADSSALGTWTSAACFGSACGTAGTGSSVACKS